MFTRPPGWILLHSPTGHISHYFREGQGKAVCGTSSLLSSYVTQCPVDEWPKCKRCLKYRDFKKIARTGRKHRDSPWGGLKY